MVISVSQIPNLPLAVALNGTEQFEIVQGGTTMRTSLSAMGTYLGTTSLGTVSSVGASGGTTGMSFSGSPITTTGTLTLTGTLNPTNGGTGLTTVTANALVLGNGTDALIVLAPGTNGQVLTAHTGSAPTWETAATGSVSSVAASGGTTGLSFTGSPITSSGTLTLTGTLAVTNGGTGVTNLDDHGLLIGNGASAVTVLTNGTNGQVLTAHAGSDPTWETPGSGGTVTDVSVVSANGFAGSVADPNTTPAITITTTQTGVLYGDGTGINGLDGATGELLIGNTGGAPTWLAGGSDSQVLTAHSGSDPTWETAASAGVSTFSTGTTGLQPVGPASGDIVLSGTLIVENGGTGQDTLTANGLLYGAAVSVGVTAEGATGQLLIGTTSAAPSWLSAGSDDQVLTAHTGAAPTWENPAATGVTTFSTGTTGLTPVGPDTGDIVLDGILEVANGGTGITSFGTGIATWLETPNATNFYAATIAGGKTGDSGSKIVFADNATMTSPTFLGGANTDGPFTSGTGPITTNTPSLFIEQEWNDAGVNFEAIHVDITDSGHLDNSYLLHLLVGGVNRFSVDIYGNGVFNSGIYNGDLVNSLGPHVANSATSIPAGGTAGAGHMFSSTANFGVHFGSGAPTASTAQGSLYLRSNGVPSYNTNGTTGWEELVTLTTSQTMTNKTLTSPIVGTQSASDNSTKAASTAYADRVLTQLVIRVQKFTSPPTVVTISAATNSVVSWTAHGLPVGGAFQLTTTGALPSPVVANTTYYVIAASFGANSFRYSTTPGGTAVNTNGSSQSGVHTATPFYVPNANLIYTVIDGVGGGGGGGGTGSSAGTTISVASGGGGGGWSMATVSAASIGASKAVTVGKFGAGGATGANAGAAGSDSVVSTFITAKGGGGGGSASGSAAPNGGGFNANGTGDVSVAGQDGFYGCLLVSVTGASIIATGAGGASRYGGGGGPGAGSDGSAPIAGYGGGGGGGGTNPTFSVGTHAGGPGASGIVIFTEYCKA